jgi:hypothetical protein
MALHGLGNPPGNESRVNQVKYWEIIADNLGKAGGVRAGFHPSILAGERSGFQMHIAATANVSLCERMKS